MSIEAKTYAAASPRRVAFIGLGVMGYPMAGHLARAGHSVTVFNRTHATALKWTQEFGGATAPSPHDAAAGAEFVCVCVGADADVRQVILGDHGALSGMEPGSILVDHTTASATLARELYDVSKARGVHFVDAPVSGGQAGAQRGTLTIMCGGDESAVTALGGVAAAYAATLARIGAAGTGQLAKMVNQLCIAGVVQGLAEGIALGQAAGLDMPRVLEVISKGAAQSWQMDNRGATMLADRFDFGFAVDWMRKDLGLCLTEAAAHAVPLPLARLVDSFYAELQAMGGGRWDTSSLLRRLRPGR